VPRFVADLHIHSRFSRATSPELVPEQLDYWARLKGIHLLGTGDCIHPGWLDELEAKLEPIGNGFHRLKPARRIDEALGAAAGGETTSFVLTTEISSIYKRDGKVRKVHNVCVFPDIATARLVQARLERIGNIRSDGRPILGLDARDLLEIVLEASPRSILIPAHIWTPWFSVLGSKSGFDSIEECFGDLTSEIFAVETGLSSNPPMIRSCSFLDRFRLVSFSDAHSLSKLGREATLFAIEPSYDAMRQSLKTGEGFGGTIEFFPEEGKYHLDGHRACKVRWRPAETTAHAEICPVCGKPVTIGVLYRVAELADRFDSEQHPTPDPFRSITPLTELLAEIMGRKSSTSKKVQAEYLRLLRAIGPEFEILLESEREAIRAAGGEILAEGIARLRRGQVHLESGYDGEFGRVRVFAEGEIE
jgi:uncharacterized protein (TIGR00375 family)